MGIEVEKSSVWTPDSEAVDGLDRKAIMAKLVVHRDTLRLRGREFTGQVVIQAPVFTHRISEALTVACELADKHLPISVECRSWRFSFIDVDLVAFVPERWYRIDPATGLRVQR